MGHYPKKILTLLLLAIVAVAFYATARPVEGAFEAARQGREQQEKGGSKGEKPQEPKRVFMKADRVYSIEAGDSMATCMVGNFVALHNGAVITCDSAVRYDDQTLECFGNVLINQNTTYIYGDRADYQGKINKAEVYSPLVKVVDGEATLYTFRFTFDTYEQVGEFSRGGFLQNRGNQLEAERGYYFSDSHDLVCVGHVEMRDSAYLMMSDSVRYNTDRDFASFFRNTHIWNGDDYLYGDEGSYDRMAECYTILKNGYILTPTEEFWSDSLDYFKLSGHVIMRHRIQIDDTQHKTLAFGDYGEYYKDPGSSMLTREPSLVSYDTTQGDSLFMRSDTILLLTTYTTRPEFNPWAPKPLVLPDSLVADTLPGVVEKTLQTAAETTEEQTVDSKESTAVGAAATAATANATSKEVQTPGRRTPAEAGKPSMGETPTRQLPDHLKSTPKEQAERAAEGDSQQLLEGAPADSLSESALLDSIVDQRDSAQRLQDSLDTLTVKARKAYFKRIAREEKAAVKAQKEAERAQKLKIIARARQAKITAQLNRMDSLEKLRLERRRAKMQAKLEAKRQRAIRRGKELPDSSALGALDSLIAQKQVADSLAHLAQDSLALDSLAGVMTAADSLRADSLRRADSLALAGDTIRRITRGYRNVRIYRTDFQAVCDSIVGLAVDSTMHLFIDPVLWSDNNQVTSDVMDVYTLNQAIDHIDFVGRPIMVSAIDSIYFNQISGKEMTAWFAENEIFRHDVNGNVETIYFLQDDPSSPVNSVFVIQSGEASFYMEDRQVVSMTYRNQNEYSMMPMDKIPATQQLFLKEYKWLPDRRPTRDSVFLRKIRPSQRERKTKMARPNFPQTERILRYRTRLLESGYWADRDDVLSFEVQEWVRRNGFEPSQPRKEFR